ncbi:APC family permease [Actinospica sp. MGRD01-02]|uniref:APC family permease n=1 Tax=Actinospica acidithermotolerans TaxID=2828514 RepID=A0A941IIN7_9ACTN|nr:APC family permease [Actinospica acidithermotolerans]MBR7826992.1 APC family permease [Actinospica acidithermotolerans]
MTQSATQSSDIPDRTDSPVVEIAHLHRNLRRFDIVALGVAAVIGVDTIGQIATGGGEAITWTVVLALLFLVPYALIFAETGAAFPQEGGPYVWVKLAYGRTVAAMTTMFYWVTNPVWLGGSLVFGATAAWNSHVFHLGSGTFGDYAFKLVFIWLSILTAIISLSRGKWITIIGAIAKVFVVLAVTVTALVYGFQHGFDGLHSTGYRPTVAGFLALAPVLLFALSGFEAPNAAGDEMNNPKKDVPVSIGISAGVAACCYLLPVVAILAVVPADKVTGVAGFMDTAGLVFGAFGSWGGPLLTATAVMFCFVLLTQGSAWMIVSDRMQAMAAADGGFFGRSLGAFHPKLGTPVRMNMVSGITATVFTVAATVFVNGSAAADFTVVLTVAVTTLLLSYLVIVPALGTLRKKQPEIVRPYRVPGGSIGFRVCMCVVYAWIVVGSWVALFPGTLNSLLGQSYSFTDSWGLSQGTFETFTLGTVVVLLAVVGVRTRRLRG